MLGALLKLIQTSYYLSSAIVLFHSSAVEALTNTMLLHVTMVALTKVYSTTAVWHSADPRVGLHAWVCAVPD